MSHTGQKHCKPHLHIPGVTPLPQRYHVGAGQRHSLKLAVFINLHAGVFIKETTGSGYIGHEEGQAYQTKQGKEAQGMVEEEYKDCVKAAYAKFSECPEFAAHGNDMLLVHDRSTSHPRQPIPGVPWALAEHPPRSPDMMPLDYSLFGTAKNKLMEATSLASSWEERVKLFLEILQQEPVAAMIREFPLRMKAAIASGGLHLMDALRVLKKK